MPTRHRRCAIPRRPLHAAQDALGDRLAAVAELPADDLAALLNIIDGLVAKNRLKTLAGGLRRTLDHAHAVPGAGPHGYGCGSSPSSPFHHRAFGP